MAVIKPQTPNLIDTISAGYAALNRRLWVLLLPIALDVFLWFGPRFSLEPLLYALNDRVASSLVLVSPDPLQQVGMGEYLQQVDTRVLLALVNFVPSLLSNPAIARAQGAALAAGGVPVSNLVELVGTGLIINFVMLLVSSLFLTMLASGVSNEHYNLRRGARQVIDVAERIARFLLLLVGAGFLLSLPFVVLSGIIVALVPGALVAVTFIWMLILFWIWIYTGFGIEAIVLSHARSLRAIANSVRLVRHNLTAVLLLLIISLVISAGLGVIWTWLATTPVGMLVAIIGSAYVQSGLIAARLVFYRDRLQR